MEEDAHKLVLSPQLRAQPLEEARSLLGAHSLLVLGCPERIVLLVLPPLAFIASQLGYDNRKEP